MLQTAHTPMQALSVQSFHNDSPPFTGSTDRHLEPVPALNLNAGSNRGSRASSPERPAYLNAPAFAAAVDATPRNLQMPPLPPGTGSIGTVTLPAPPMPTTAVSVNPSPRPRSPSEQSASSSMSCAAEEAIGPTGAMEAYTDLDRPSRISSPIDLKYEAESYHFPKHRLRSKMRGTRGENAHAIIVCREDADPQNSLPPGSVQMRRRYR